MVSTLAQAKWRSHDKEPSPHERNEPPALARFGAAIAAKNGIEQEAGG
jgi:hypothetical protein